MSRYRHEEHIRVFISHPSVTHHFTNDHYATMTRNNRSGGISMTFRPQLCIRIDEETELRIYEERHAQEVAELVDQNRHLYENGFPG